MPNQRTCTITKGQYTVCRYRIMCIGIVKLNVWAVSYMKDNVGIMYITTYKAEDNLICVRVLEDDPIMPPIHLFHIVCI